MALINLQSNAVRVLMLAVVAVVLWMPYDHIFSSAPQLRGIFTAVFPDAFHHFLGHTIIFSFFGSALLVIVAPLRHKQFMYIAICILAAIVQEGIQAIFLKDGLQFDRTAFCGDSLGSVIALMCCSYFLRKKS